MIAVVNEMISVIVILDRVVVEVIPDIAWMDGVENLEMQWSEEVNHEMKWMDEEVILEIEKKALECRWVSSFWVFGTTPCPSRWLSVE